MTLPTLLPRNLANLRNLMTAPILAVLVGLAALLGDAGAAGAQPAGSDAGNTATATAEPAAPPAAAASADARRACAAAMNADPQFAAEISKIADERAALKRDADTVAAHVDAEAHVLKNQRHVIYAYIAMWIVAAGFVLFLWRRQQGLVLEINRLRRDVDAAAETQPAEPRP